MVAWESELRQSVKRRSGWTIFSRKENPAADANLSVFDFRLRIVVYCSEGSTHCKFRVNNRKLLRRTSR
jgi:hypothetical protein